MDGGSELSKKHASAIAKLLAREEVVLDSLQFVRLITHLQTNVSIQKSVIAAIASVAAGKPDWEAVELAATLSERSAQLLNTFVFEIAEANSDRE